METNVQQFDLIIIGAGLFGIQGARTYLEIHNEANIVILEASNAPGGVWSRERMYDAFWTQTSLEMAEFSDRRMPLDWKSTYHGFFPAKHVTQYLEDYIDSHVYAGRSVRSRVKFNSPVSTLTKSSNLWTATIGNSNTTFTSPKLIDASGITSIPSIPSIPGQQDFSGLTLHHKEFGQSDLLSNPKYQHIIVLGGAKSGADIAYASAKAGKRVSWVIRRSGSGPAAFAGAQGLGSYRSTNESFYNRFMSYFLVSLFKKPSWVMWFLNKTPIGRFFVRRVWSFLDNATRKSAHFERPDGKENGFYLLEPDTSLFWQNDSTGVNQRPDFFDILATKVNVYRCDVDRLSKTGMVLENGTEIDADAILYATGWKPVHPYIQETTARELGLPVPVEKIDPKEEARWRELEKAADVEVLDRFPALRDPPNVPQPEVNLTPYRLYKSILPINDHSIVFLGRFTSGEAFLSAEVQSIWAVAALDGNVDLPSSAVMEYDVAMTVAWCRRRYLSKGRLANWFYWDPVPYTDMLLEQLGLRSHQRRGWFRNFFGPCFARDLKGLIGEYKGSLTEKKDGRRA